MFAVAVELLCGRYTATQFNDRSEAEWPPHPARLFSAMTAVWADADEPDSAERAALKWLEGRPPPSIACSEARRRNVVTHFVPVNDATALVRNVSRTYARMAVARAALGDAERSGDDHLIKRARTAFARAEATAIADADKAGKATSRESASVAAGVLEVLPENRGKQGRTYPTVIPDDAAFWFVWPEAMPPDHHRDALDRLLSRVGRLGHSSTLVSCTAVASAPEPGWVPVGEAQGEPEIWLRVPKPGLIDRLEVAYQMHRGGEPRLLPAGTAGYRRPSVPSLAPPVPLLGGDWIVLGLRGRPLPAVRVLDVARATRGALMKHGEQPVPSILSGHQPTRADTPSAPPLDGPHLAVVPLPNAGHRYSNGTILGIALVLPARCAPDDRAAVEHALQAWSDAGFELLVQGDSLSLEIVAVDRAVGGASAWLSSDLGSRRRTTTRGYWCRPARRWLTVTPIALDRFPGNLRDPRLDLRERAEAEAREAISRACEFAGLPGDPRVTIRLDAPLSGLPSVPAGPPGDRKAWRFPGYHTGGGTPRACVHAEITFREPVRGPVLIGAGRYFGYGLCLPSDATVADA